MQLNPEQQRVVESDSRCRVVIAGPGSGKTRTLVEAIAKLIRDGTPSRAIAAVTFTNAAARELERRIQETFFNNTLRLGYCGTLHGLLLRWIQATSDNRLSIADEQQTEAMLAESIARLRFTGTKEAVRELLMRGPQFAPGRSLTRTELVAADFWQTMQSAGLLDFDAILHRGLRLLRDGAAGREFTHLFVDETQDSGEMDALIYDAMPTPLKTFFGDSDQSVYGFRGGRPEYLMRLARSEASATFYLRGNYRCGSAICAAANRLIENNTDRLDKWTVSATNLRKSRAWR
jgi:DNA helicase-2/ATP-dependent DNA helicase PcrA